MPVGVLGGLPPRVQLLVGVWAILVTGLVLGFGYWVYHDASLRGSSHPLGWAVASAVGIGVMTVGYPLVRERIGHRSEPPTRIDRAVVAAVLGIVGAFVVGSIVTPPDPFAQIVFVTGAVVVTIPAAYVLVGRHDRQTATN